MVSVTTTQLCCRSRKAAPDDTNMNRPDCVPIKLYLQNEVGWQRGSQPFRCPGESLLDRGETKSRAREAKTRQPGSRVSEQVVFSGREGR